MRSRGPPGERVVGDAALDGAGRESGTVGPVRALGPLRALRPGRADAGQAAVDGEYDAACAVEEGLALVLLEHEELHPVQGLQALVEDVARRLDRLLARRDLGEDADVQPDDLQGQLQLSSATAQDARSGRPSSRTRRVAHVRPFDRSAGALEASHAWFSLHAGTRVRAADRRGLELLARYVLRPAVALGRLGADSGDDTVTLTFRHPWADGTGAIQLDPVDFVGRLAALVPPPRRNLTRYHGVLAPAHPWRAEIVPDPPKPRERRST